MTNEELWRCLEEKEKAAHEAIDRELWIHMGEWWAREVEDYRAEKERWMKEYDAWEAEKDRKTPDP